MATFLTFCFLHQKIGIHNYPRIRTRLTIRLLAWSCHKATNTAFFSFWSFLWLFHIRLGGLMSRASKCQAIRIRGASIHSDYSYPSVQGGQKTIPLKNSYNVVQAGNFFKNLRTYWGGTFAIFTKFYEIIFSREKNG